jgi:glycosyltransferase involved in cell wall biosynthesis
MAIGPATGGVGDVFRATMAALADSQPVEVHSLPASGVPAMTGVRFVYRHRRSILQARSVHVELGSNDLAVFWAGLATTVLRDDVALVVHDAPKVAHRPAAGIVPMHGAIWRRLGHRLLSPLLDGVVRAALLRRVGRIATLGRGAAEMLRAEGLQDVTVIPHGGSPPTPHAPPPSRGDYVLFAGYIGASKGLDTLLQAWLAVGDQAPLPLRIVGDVPPGLATTLEELRDRASKLRQPPRWEPAIQAEDLFQRLFATAAIVVLPYRTSSAASGIAVRAMIEGRCIVATRVPALDLLEDRLSALLVEPGDAVGLAEALRVAMGDLGLRDGLGSAAGAVGRRMTWSATADAVARLHRSA